MCLCTGCLTAIISDFQSQLRTLINYLLLHFFSLCCLLLYEQNPFESMHIYCFLYDNVFSSFKQWIPIKLKNGFFKTKISTLVKSPLKIKSILAKSIFSWQNRFTKTGFYYRFSNTVSLEWKSAFVMSISSYMVQRDYPSIFLE